MSNSISDLAAFLAEHVRPYDPATDDYERPPFAADIKEGKNDPIYSAHSYHTKVPPRSIIPYILHYTQPGDLVLDLFCGSGMTGVAAQMCANPPADILEQFPELKNRVGPRPCILNDLSPAACHIAFNYNTRVDVEALKREFERIKADVDVEFNWLYGTEHYEPAVGVYDVSNPDVASRLKNPPAGKSKHNLLEEDERTWVLLTKAEVEARLGYPVTELPRNGKWGALDVAKVKHWVCIPATIQYTIWSDVYRCEGFVTIEEPTGNISTRGKNAGKPQTTKRKVSRGCGKDIILGEVAFDLHTGAVNEDFKCPHCGQEWQKLALNYQRIHPVSELAEWIGVDRRPTRTLRRPSANGQSISIDKVLARLWHPNEEIWEGRELMTMGANKKGIRRQSDFYTKRNLAALAIIYSAISKVTNKSIKERLRYSFTAIVLKASRLNRLRPSGAGDPLTASLYVASLIREENVFELWARKAQKQMSLDWSYQMDMAFVINGDATDLKGVEADSVDYIFTDPPFGGNIYYADASLLWEAWLTSYTDEKRELVFNRQRHQDENFKELKHYTEGMQHAFAEMYRVLKPNRWVTVEFNNSDGSVFEAIKLAAERAGLVIANMLLLDKKQKSFKQVKGAKGEEDVVDKDVLFNLYKPPSSNGEFRMEDVDLEQKIADEVRSYLSMLPERIRSEPSKYNDEHRTTATINSMLMNALIPRGVSVERLSLPFIDRVCSRYFRKIGQRWYLRGEAIGFASWLGEEIQVKDELTAIAWLRQQIKNGPRMLGELKPLWMRATGMLGASVSTNLSLERLLVENFWRETASNRWREPTSEERGKMNDDQSLRVFHDADRLVSGTLGRIVGNAEVCEWINVLFGACKELEDGGEGAAAAHLGFDKMEGFRLIVRLSQRLTPGGLEAKTLINAKKQAAVAGRRLAESAERAPTTAVKTAKARRDEGPTLFDLVN